MKRAGHIKAKLVVGATICAITIITTVTLVFAAIGHNFFAEPKNRPNINKNAIWDSELGMYISGDFEKDSKSRLIQKEEITDMYDGAVVTSPEQEWIAKHSDSKDPIDLAILKAVSLESQSKPSLLSSIQVENAEGVQEAIKDLTPEQLPELWRRACEEPAFRAFKLEAMEKLLGISFNVGLYDKNSQKSWYESFRTLKKELKQKAFQKETDYTKYGLLALPVLSEAKADSGDDVGKAMKEVLQKQGIASSLSDTELEGWIDSNSDCINAVSQVIDAEYDWTEP